MASTLSAALDVEECLSKLSNEDKLALLSGSSMWETHRVDELGIPPMRVSDGPNGIRGIRFFNGHPSNCFPCATGLAASFDEELLYEVGQQYGEECHAKGAHMWLGPTLNMQRSPLGGRGFESFSEDPVLSGLMSASIIRGVQSRGVSAFPKHFVCNDQETDRHSNSAEVSMRALREIYLKPFQICIKQGDPWGLMTSYNRVNGIHVPEHPLIMNEILREEWGFDGTVMSDWYGTYSTVEGVNASVDLEMPGPTIWRGRALARALTSGKISQAAIDSCARRMIKSAKHAIESGIPAGKEEEGIDTPDTRALLLKAAQEAVVLIKNESNSLPLKAERVKKLAVIGPNAKVACISGGGSASLKPYYAISPLSGISDLAVERGIETRCSAGVHVSRYLPLIDEMVKCLEGQAGRMNLSFFPEEPVNPAVKPVHIKLVDSSYAFMLDNIPFDIVPRKCWMNLDAIFTPDESGDWHFGLTVAGQAEIFLDGKTVVANKEDQRPGEIFFSNGTEEEIGTVSLVKGKEYRLQMRWSNFKRVNPKVAFAVFGGFRIGARLASRPEDLLAEAVDLAKSSDAVVIVAGLNADFEGEGFDRSDMRLPSGTDELVRQVLQANSNTCVVIQSGTQTEMPWFEQAPAVVQAFYGGNETGRAIANVLFGVHNPSGRMPLSFPKKLADFPSHPFVPGKNGYSYYTEDVFMGYRGMLLRGAKPLACFGHGLSYTTFEIADVRVGAVEMDADKGTVSLSISAHVRNTGDVTGKEVLQVYISPPEGGPLPRPSRELAAFAKVTLAPGEETSIKVTVDRSAFSYWDISKEHGDKRGAWCVDAGEYHVHVGNSLENVTASLPVVLSSSFTWRGL